MPYIDGRRVSNEEWSNRPGSSTFKLHTSERGENPGDEGVVLAEAGAPDNGKEEDGDRKVVVGTHVLDVPDQNDADTDSVASGELSGDIPGEGSGDSNESGEADENEADDEVPATAPEAAADFVEKSKARKAKA